MPKRKSEDYVHLERQLRKLKRRMKSERRRRRRDSSVSSSNSDISDSGDRPSHDYPYGE